MTVDFFASQPHYLDHLLPLWEALDDAERGTFHVPARLIGYVERRLASSAAFAVAMPEASDAPLTVAGASDLREGRRHVLVEHGAGQTYLGVDNPSYSGGSGRDQVDLFLCPNEEVAARNRARYPHARALAIGSPKLDADRLIRRVDPAPRVAISFHWNAGVAPESRSAFRHYADALRPLHAAVPTIGHAHPRAFARLARIYEKVGIQPVADWQDVLRLADVYICDNSSTLYEFAALGRPVVVLNAPWYRRDVEHGLRFWRDADVGEQVDTPEALVPAVLRALDHGRIHDPRPGEITRAIYGGCGLGDAALHGVEAIRDMAGVRA